MLWKRAPWEMSPRVSSTRPCVFQLGVLPAPTLRCLVQVEQTLQLFRAFIASRASPRAAWASMSLRSYRSRISPGCALKPFSFFECPLGPGFRSHLLWDHSVGRLQPRWSCLSEFPRPIGFYALPSNVWLQVPVYSFFLLCCTIPCAVLEGVAIPGEYSGSGNQQFSPRWQCKWYDLCQDARFRKEA